MRVSAETVDESAEELFEGAPLRLRHHDARRNDPAGQPPFLELTGFSAQELVGRGRRLRELLSPGGRIYHETHYAPLLRMQGWVREIAVDFVRADGTRLPALLNSVLRTGASGTPELVRTTVFDATERRRYEAELLRARDREHRIAEILQRSLLAGALPSDPRLDVAVEYLPAVADHEVGGDWYDAFLVGPREVALVVGDVVGRGIEAAAVMGQLRSAVRALATTGAGPGALLDALDRYVGQHDVGGMATVAYARLSLDTGELCLATAGHPPPAVVVPGGGPPAYVMAGRSAPLDAYLTPVEREETSLTLPEGGVFLLFSDGLFERADRPLDAGLDRVLEELGARRDRPAAEIAQELPRAMLPGRRSRDDVCVVVARRAPRYY